MRWNANDHYHVLIEGMKNFGFALNSYDIILDLGCGSGELTRLFRKNFKPRLFIGMDIQQNTAWLKDKNSHYLVCDAHTLPFKDLSIDVLIEKDALHHCLNPTRVMREIKRVTKNLVVIIEANRYNPISFIHMTLICKHDHLSKAQFSRLLKTVFYNNKINFFQIESHVYPTGNVRLLKMIHIIEELLSEIPIINRFLNYNIAVIRISQ